MKHYSVLHYYSLSLSLAILLSLTRAADASAETLDFSQCVAIALHQNFTLVASQEQINQAQAGLDQVQASRIPKLTASLNAIGTDDALTAFGLKLSQRNATFNDFGANQFNPSNPNGLSVAPNSLNYPGYVTNFNTRLELQLPVYTGGMITASIKQAQAYIKAAQNGDSAARQQVIFEVLKAYQGVHATRAYLAVTKQAEITARSQVDMMTKLVNHGVIVKSDLLSAQVHLLDIQVQHAQAENAVANALDQLHLLLGMPLATALDVGPPVTIKPALTKSSALNQAAMADNPAVLALRNQLEASQAGVDIAKAGYQPQIGLMLRQEWNDQQLGFGASSYTIGGTISWTVFDGGVIKAGVARASALQDENMAKLAETEANISYQAADAERKASEADQRLGLRQLAQTQAEEAADLVNKRYVNGVATITEQLGAQTQLDQARANVVAAQYDLAIQRANLKLALGQLELDQLSN